MRSSLTQIVPYFQWINSYCFKMVQRIVSAITKGENKYGSCRNVRFKLLFDSVVEEDVQENLFPYKGGRSRANDNL